MSHAAARPDQTAPAPEGFRDALAKLVQFGVTVARLVARMADAEMALADAAAQAGVAEGISAVATSLAEAIEADQAASAAAEARQTVVARAEAIAAAFASVSRAVRLTILLAERMDCGWARGGVSDGRRAIARRQIARGVKDAIAREAEGERAERLTEALGERLDRMDRETGIGDRPAQEIIEEICRDLELGLVRMTVRGAERNGSAPPLPPLRPGGERGWTTPPQRRPDG